MLFEIPVYTINLCIKPIKSRETFEIINLLTCFYLHISFSVRFYKELHKNNDNNLYCRFNEAYIYSKILDIYTYFAFLSWPVSSFDLWPFCRKWNVLLLSWCFTSFISRGDQDENYIWIVKVLDKLSRGDIFKLRESFYQVDSWNVRRCSVLE